MIPFGRQESGKGMNNFKLHDQYPSNVGDAGELSPSEGAAEMMSIARRFVVFESVRRG